MLQFILDILVRCLFLILSDLNVTSHK